MVGKIILLVEDNQDDIDLTLRYLRKSNILNELVVVRDGAEAIDYFSGIGGCATDKPQKDTPTVILLDLKLPKIDGLEVLKRLRAEEKTKLLPVIIFSSSKEEEDLVNGYSFGANSYVHKPIDFNQFAEAVRQLQLYWLVLNEPPPR